MAITYPVNLLPVVPGWTTGFDLRLRQEQSVQASGRVLVKDMGSPLWTAAGGHQAFHRTPWISGGPI